MLTRAGLTRVLSSAVLLLMLAPHVSAQQAVIVVRHAEKTDQTPDSALSPPGRTRATALADVLRGAGVTHIVTSEYRRTRETAEPLATALGLTIETVPARDLPALMARLRGLDPASIVVVIGHSNTIPPMLAALGWPNQLDLHEGDYDDLFVLAPRAGERASLVRLKYGRQSS